jgi:hypothetical protein
MTSTPKDHMQTLQRIGYDIQDTMAQPCWISMATD